MSNKDVMRFIVLIEKDEELKLRFQKVEERLKLEGMNQKIDEKLFNEEIIPIAKSKGLEFTFEEFQTLYEGKFLDDELDKM